MTNRTPLFRTVLTAVLILSVLPVLSIANQDSSSPSANKTTVVDVKNAAAHWVRLLVYDQIGKRTFEIRPGNTRTFTSYHDGGFYATGVYFDRDTGKLLGSEWSDTIHLGDASRSSVTIR